MSARPDVISTARSSQPHRRNSQPCVPNASAAIPRHAVIVIHATSSHEPLGGALSSRATPAGSSTKTNGTTNAGSVYFHACNVVLYGSPPVMAAAANGESAVGGDTSDNTA